MQTIETDGYDLQLQARDALVNRLARGALHRFDRSVIEQLADVLVDHGSGEAWQNVIRDVFPRAAPTDREDGDAN